MSPISRRKLLGAAAAGAAAAVIPGAIGSAAPNETTTATETAALTTTGTIADVQHVVILMQENRSFDHYFGTMKGVRGFGDRATIPLPGDYSVFNQPNGDQAAVPVADSAPRSGRPGRPGPVSRSATASLDHGWSTSTRRGTAARWTPGWRRSATSARWAS